MSRGVTFEVVIGADGWFRMQGVFGVPLSELVDREGVDSTLGIGHGPVRIPSFVDDIITALKQMGELSLFRY